MNKGMTTIWVVLLTAVFSLAVGAGGSYWYMSQDGKIKLGRPKPTSEPQLKVYRNEFRDFSFNYPGTYSFAKAYETAPNTAEDWAGEFSHWTGKKIYAGWSDILIGGPFQSYDVNRKINVPVKRMVHVAILDMPWSNPQPVPSGHDHDLLGPEDKKTAPNIPGGYYIATGAPSMEDKTFGSCRASAFYIPHGEITIILDFYECEDIVLDYEGNSPYEGYNPPDLKALEELRDQVITSFKFF